MNKEYQLHYLKVWLTESLRVESTELYNEDDLHASDRWYTFQYCDGPHNCRLQAWFESDGCDSGPYNIDRFDVTVAIDSCEVVFTNTEYPYVKLPLRQTLEWIDSIN